MSMVSGFLLFDLVEFYAGFNVAGAAYLNKSRRAGATSRQDYRE
jgi:hypothetical protein